MIKCRRRQATGPQKLKKLSTVFFSFFVGGSGSDGCGSGSDGCGSGIGRRITASTSLGRTPTFGVILKTIEKLIKNWNELLPVGSSETNKFDQKRFG